MIVQCPKCQKVRVDPKTIRDVLDDDIVVEAWASPLQTRPTEVGVVQQKCPWCLREKKCAK